MVYLSLDNNEQYLVLTSYTNSIAKHHFHSIGTDGLLTFLGVKGDLNYDKVPDRVIMKGVDIYIFFSGKDQLYITDITTNISVFLTLPLKDKDVMVTVDHEKAVIWDTKNA